VLLCFLILCFFFFLKYFYPLFRLFGSHERRRIGKEKKKKKKAKSFVLFEVCTCKSESWEVQVLHRQSLALRQPSHQQRSHGHRRSSLSLFSVNIIFFLSQYPSLSLPMGFLFFAFLVSISLSVISPVLSLPHCHVLSGFYSGLLQRMGETTRK
jgi:hypothetical protein